MPVIWMQKPVTETQNGRWWIGSIYENFELLPLIEVGDWRGFFHIWYDSVIYSDRYNLVVPITLFWQVPNRRVFPPQESSIKQNLMMSLKHMIISFKEINNNVVSICQVERMGLSYDRGNDIK